MSPFQTHGLIFSETSRNLLICPQLQPNYAAIQNPLLQEKRPFLREANSFHAGVTVFYFPKLTFLPGGRNYCYRYGKHADDANHSRE